MKKLLLGYCLTLFSCNHMISRTNENHNFWGLHVSYNILDVKLLNTDTLSSDHRFLIRSYKYCLKNDSNIIFSIVALKYIDRPSVKYSLDTFFERSLKGYDQMNLTQSHASRFNRNGLKFGRFDYVVIDADSVPIRFSNVGTVKNNIIVSLQIMSKNYHISDSSRFKDISDGIFNSLYIQ